MCKIMEVSVFDCYDLTEELREYVCAGQSSDSFTRIHLDGGEWDDLGAPLDLEARVAQWAKDHGAVESGKDPYVLFSMSW